MRECLCEMLAGTFDRMFGEAASSRDTSFTGAEAGLRRSCAKACVTRAGNEQGNASGTRCDLKQGAAALFDRRRTELGLPCAAGF
eukprot:8484089-Pyramimonas_sp.AAC.1